MTIDPNSFYEALVKDGCVIYHSDQRIDGGSVVSLSGKEVVYHRLSLDEETISLVKNPEEESYLEGSNSDDDFLDGDRLD